MNFSKLKKWKFRIFLENMKMPIFFVENFKLLDHTLKISKLKKNLNLL